MDSRGCLTTITEAAGLPKVRPFLIEGAVWFGMKADVTRYVGLVIVGLQTTLQEKLEVTSGSRVGAEVNGLLIETCPKHDMPFLGQHLKRPPCQEYGNAEGRGKGDNRDLDPSPLSS